MPKWCSIPLTIRGDSENNNFSAGRISALLLVKELLGEMK